MEENFPKAENARQKCSFCGRQIPKDVRRISFSTKTRFGYSYTRICGWCILQLAGRLKSEKDSIKAIEDWGKKIMIEEEI
jgi:hypothetical protein